MSSERNSWFAATLRTCLGFTAAFAIAAPLSAQEDLGVTMGSWHLNVADVAATKEMFEAMGATPLMMDGMEGVQIPGVAVYLRGSTPTGGTLGTVIEHVGVHVPNVDEAIERWQAAGVPIEHSGAPFPQAWITTADGLRIEVLQNPEQEQQVRHHHIHFYVPETAIPEAQEWYAEVFGAVPGMRGRFQAADIPGANLTFSAADGDRVPTKGRALDRVGFVVPDLASFCQHVQGRSDVEFSGPCQGMAASLVDPWGSHIDVVQAH